MSLNVVGIDVGVLNSRVAIYKKTSVEVLENEYGSLQTPTCVGFIDGIRWVGTDAHLQRESNLSGTVTEFPSLVGKRMNDPDVAVDREYLTFSLTNTMDGRIAIPLKYGTKTMNFRPEHLLAMQIKKLKLMAENALGTNILREVVVGVPMSYGTDEKRAVIDAARVAGLNRITLLNATTAVGISFAFSGVMLPEEGMPEKMVAFVDIGHKYTQLSICAFHKRKMNVVGTACDTNLGGRNFNRLMAEKIMSEVATLDPSHTWNPTATMRLMQEVERLKIRMCSNADALPICIDYLRSKKVYNSKISRADFEIWAGSLFTRFRNLITDCLEKCMVNPVDISAVQLIGGSSQIPAIQKIITDIFKRAKFISEGSDTVVRGCTLYASLLAKTPTARGLDVVDNTVNENNVNGHLVGLDERQIGEMLAFENEISKRELQEHCRLAAKSALVAYCSELKQVSLGIKEQMELMQVCSWLESAEHTQAEYEKRLFLLKNLNQPQEIRSILRKTANDAPMNAVQRLTASFTALNIQRRDGPVRIIGSTTNLSKDQTLKPTSSEKISRPHFEFHSEEPIVESFSSEQLLKPTEPLSNQTSESVSYEKLARPSHYVEHVKQNRASLEKLSKSTEQFDIPLRRNTSLERISKFPEEVSEPKPQPVSMNIDPPTYEPSSGFVSRPIAPVVQTWNDRVEAAQNSNLVSTSLVNLRRQYFSGYQRPEFTMSNATINSAERNLDTATHAFNPVSRELIGDSTTLNDLPAKARVSFTDLPRASEPVIYRTYSVRPLKDLRWHSGIQFMGMKPDPLPLPSTHKPRHGSVTSSAHDLSQTASTTDSSPAKKALELYILTVQHQLQSRANVLLDRPERQALVSLLEDMKYWLKQHGNSRPNYEYEERLDKLRSRAEHLDEHLDRAEKAIADYERVLEKIRTVLQTGKHNNIILTSPQLKELTKVLSEREAWLRFCLEQADDELNPHDMRSSVELLRLKTREVDVIFRDIISNPNAGSSASGSKEQLGETGQSDSHHSSHATFPQSTPIPQLSASSSSDSSSSQESVNAGSRFSDYYSNVEGDAFVDQPQEQQVYTQEQKNGSTGERVITIIRDIEETVPQQQQAPLMQESTQKQTYSSNVRTSALLDRPETFPQLYDHLLQFESALTKKTLFQLSIKYKVYVKHQHETAALNQVLRKMRSEIEYFARPSAHYQRMKNAIKEAIGFNSPYLSTQETDKIIRSIEHFQHSAREDLGTLRSHMEQCLSWLSDMARTVPGTYAKIYICAREDLLSYLDGVVKMHERFDDVLTGFIQLLRARPLSGEHPMPNHFSSESRQPFPVIVEHVGPRKVW